MRLFIDKSSTFYASKLLHACPQYISVSSCIHSWCLWTHFAVNFIRLRLCVRTMSTIWFRFNVISTRTSIRMHLSNIYFRKQKKLFRATHFYDSYIIRFFDRCHNREQENKTKTEWKFEFFFPFNWIATLPSSH